MANFSYSSLSAFDFAEINQQLDSGSAELDNALTPLESSGDLQNAEYSNTRITGNYGEWSVVIRGSNFNNQNPVITSYLVSNAAGTVLKVSGRIDSDTGGVLTSMSLATANFAVNYVGSFKINADGDIVSSRVTSYQVSTSTFKIVVSGNMYIDVDSGELTGGVITSLSLEGSDGEYFSAKNISMLATDFDSLTDADQNIQSLFDSISKAGNDVIVGGSGNDSIAGGTGSDTLQGGLGDDTLDGGVGADSLVGGAGDDLYVVDSIKDKVVEGKDLGIDSIESSVSYTLGANVEVLRLTGSLDINATGNTLANSLIGNSGANILNGGAGADTMQGGAGNDTYVVDNAEDVVTESEDEGTDTIRISIATKGGSYSLGDHIENGILANTVAFSLIGNDLHNTLTGNAAANTLDGGIGNDSLLGGAGNDSLLGGAGDDTLDGGAGNDTMDGGEGSDVYVVNAIGDVIADSGTGVSDIDVVQSTVNYTLNDGVENLILTGKGNLSGTGSAQKNVITGNTGANRLDGGAGDDTLSGGLGADTLIGGLGADHLEGGAGNDTYEVDDIGDEVIELANEGTDLVKSSIDYTLGDYLENLTLTGTAHIDATGNSLNNTLIGNDGNNVLTGGAGADLLKGGKGNDTYQVNLISSGTGSKTVAKLEDSISEATNASGGDDTLALQGTISGLSKATVLTLASGLEHLDASGTGDTWLNLTGNAANNALTGNDASNILRGLAGNDSLSGGEGADTLYGGLGNDSLSGGEGADVFVFDSKLGATNVDTIDDFEVGVDKLKLDETIFGKLVAKGLNSDNLLVVNGNPQAQDANDYLIFDEADGSLYYDKDGSGVGAAIKIGILQNLNGTLSANDFSSSVALASSVTYSLSPSQLNLTLTGSSNINGTGNAFGNVINGNSGANALSGGAGNDSLYGNEGNDSLDGGAGADSLLGGDGDDTYIIDNLADVIVEFSDQGIDTVKSSLTNYELAYNLENLTLLNTAYSGTGNAADNYITGTSGFNVLSGNDGDDTLDGVSGGDSLFGGDGDDVYIINNAGYRVVEFEDEGQDTIISRISYSLEDTDGTGVNGGNVENLILAGSADLNGTGNELDNQITGNTGKNLLSGGLGNDTLDGAAGADTLKGGAGDDVYFVDNIDDVIVEESTSYSSQFTQGQYSNHTPSISADGRYVMFDSYNEFSFGSRTLAVDVFLKDMQTGELLKVSDYSQAFAGEISSDGRYAMYFSQGSMDGDANGVLDIYIKDLLTGETIIASSNEQNILGDESVVGDAKFSSDNTYVVFSSYSDNLVAGNSYPGSDVYLKNLSTGQLTLVSTDPSGNAGNNISIWSSISADGRYVVFYSLSSNLSSSDTNNELDVYWKDTQTNQTYLVSSSASGVVGNAKSWYGSISPDGKWVVFESQASNLVENDTNNSTDIFLKNIQTGEIQRISTNASSEQANFHSGDASFSADGRYVIFTSGASNLVEGDTNGRADIFIKDLLTGGIQLVSTNSLGQLANGSSSIASISDNGRYVVFISEANNLVDGDLNYNSDVFVKDLQTGEVKIASVEHIAVQGGTDTVNSSVSYTLGAHIENLNLIGSLAIDGSGNELNNTLVGNAAANSLYGNAGDDSVVGGGGIDQLFGGAGNDTLIGAGSLYGNDGDDHLVGAGINNDLLMGGQGNDYLNGDGGVINTLMGNEGNDTLVGSNGADFMWGGTDADVFLIGAITGGADIIGDFNTAELDRIGLSKDAMSGLGNMGTLDTSAFESGDGLVAANTEDGRIIYNTSAGHIYYDQDGVGGENPVLIAIITDKPQLDSSVFFIEQ